MASDAVSDLRRLLARRLSRSEIGLLTEDVLQRMVEKEYTTEGRLQCATLEGLLEHPTLPFAVVDVLLKAFQPGENGLAFLTYGRNYVLLPLNVCKQH